MGWVGLGLVAVGWAGWVWLGIGLGWVGMVRYKSIRLGCGCVGFELGEVSVAWNGLGIGMDLVAIGWGWFGWTAKNHGGKTQITTELMEICSA